MLTAHSSLHKNAGVRHVPVKHINRRCLCKLRTVYFIIISDPFTHKLRWGLLFSFHKEGMTRKARSHCQIFATWLFKGLSFKQVHSLNNILHVFAISSPLPPLKRLSVLFNHVSRLNWNSNRKKAHAVPVMDWCPCRMIS